MKQDLQAQLTYRTLPYIYYLTSGKENSAYRHFLNLIINRLLSIFDLTMFNFLPHEISRVLGHFVECCRVFSSDAKRILGKLNIAKRLHSTFALFKMLSTVVESNVEGVQPGIRQNP